MKPAKNKFTLLKQVIENIPAYVVPKLARKHGVDKRSRSFSPWSHIVSMIFAQLSHALSLNDVCDTLRHHAGALSTLRNALPPSRNGLSHANKVRSSEMAKDLFYETLHNFSTTFPKFGRFDTPFKISRKIKRVINLVDSTTIQLFANCMDWAKHRRRKAAAKCHMLLDAQTFLPRFAVVGSAKSHDAVKGRILCKQLKQTLKLSDFLGYSENAVQWQIWMALLTYVILRYIAYLSKWKGTFARLFTTLRGVLWSRFDMYDLLNKCGTASERQRLCMQPQQLYLPLFVN
jgi:hypothetical protein